jgi:hypothetical protein
MPDSHQTDEQPPKFDFEAYPPDTCFHERRSGADRRGDLDAETRTGAASDRRRTKDRRKRVDPTTFDKQYSEDEIEFMNAMQRFKVQSAKSFPSYAEVLRIAGALGYRQVEPPGPLPQTKARASES